MYKYRKDRIWVSLYEFLEQFATQSDAMKHIESLRWKDRRICPWCESKKTRQASHKTMPYWCGLFGKRLKYADLIGGINGRID